jgi:hypothetical protein
VQDLVKAGEAVETEQAVEQEPSQQQEQDSGTEDKHKEVQPELLE